MGSFHIATPEDIVAGKVTDAYFTRTLEILRRKPISRPVAMEIRASSFPNQWPWAVFAGLEETVSMLADTGKSIDLFSIPEGTLFRAGDPVGYLMGDYVDLCVYETAVLGLLCQATGIATRAARCVKAADGKPVLSFGTRRVHPAIAPMVDRNAYVGGCSGYSNVLAAEMFGGTASGTMPHALILLAGDTVTAARMFHEVIDPSVPRISLIDTFQDEKFEAVRVAEALGRDLYAVRLDTPSSRRGNFAEIFQEVRWELNLRGFEHVKLIASGGLDEYSIPSLNLYCDGYGIGTCISNAPVVDYALDIVEIDGQPIAKRGKYSARKRLLKNDRSLLERTVARYRENDGFDKTDLIELNLKNGKPVMAQPSLAAIRDYVIDQLKLVTLER